MLMISAAGELRAALVGWRRRTSSPVTCYWRGYFVSLACWGEMALASVIYLHLSGRFASTAEMSDCTSTVDFGQSPTIAITGETSDTTRIEVKASILIKIRPGDAANDPENRKIMAND